MAKIKCICEICGETFYRNPSAVHEHTLCSRECSRKFCKQRMSRYNTYENPIIVQRVGVKKSVKLSERENSETKEYVVKTHIQNSMEDMSIEWLLNKYSVEN